MAFDASIVNPIAVSHSGARASACGESFLDPNAGTRAALAEETKANKYKLLCQQRGMDFLPIVFTASGGMGEQFQVLQWHVMTVMCASGFFLESIFTD